MKTHNIDPKCKNLNKVEKFDSTIVTEKHRTRVKELLTAAAIELINRGKFHDASKLESPEKELFDVLTPKLSSSTFGSVEYKGFLDALKYALEHHYGFNSHHPEHYANGVNDFDLFDLIEMFFDWKAATERHDNGNIYKSIELNTERFKLSEQVASIFKNTANRLGYSK